MCSSSSKKECAQLFICVDAGIGIFVLKCRKELNLLKTYIYNCPHGAQFIKMYICPSDILLIKQ